MTRSWQLELPASPFYSANSRVHWRKKAELVRTWRHASAMLARSMDIPRLDRAVVSLDLWPHDKRRRDPDNLVPGVLKPAVDGLVDAGVLDDDTPEFVRLVMPVIHPPRKDRQVTWLLTVEEAA